MDIEQIVRRGYELAEVRDIPGFVATFTEDGTFTDYSLGVTYTGPNELPMPVDMYATAFPDMHRELYDFYLSGDDIVVVQLAL
jgi:hypothetical protein